MTDPATDPVGTVRQETFDSGHSLYAYLPLHSPVWDDHKNRWTCIYSTHAGNVGEGLGGTEVEWLRENAPVIGAVPGTPAATDAPSRCPSCEHAAEFHHDEDGCWYTVTTGLPDAPLVCPCAVIPAALRPTIEEADVVHGVGRPMSAPDREALEQIIADEIAEWSIIGERGPLARPIADRLISAGLVRTPEPALDRETLGQKVRQVWIDWASEQPDPKASWLVPWEGLSEPDREVDRRIGETLARVGISACLTRSAAHPDYQDAT